jgi:hypothetical protein
MRAVSKVQLGAKHKGSGVQGGRCSKFYGAHEGFGIGRQVVLMCTLHILYY